MQHTNCTLQQIETLLTEATLKSACNATLELHVAPDRTQNTSHCKVLDTAKLALQVEDKIPATAQCEH